MSRSNQDDDLLIFCNITRAQYMKLKLLWRDDPHYRRWPFPVQQDNHIPRGLLKAHHVREVQHGRTFFWHWGALEYPEVREALASVGIDDPRPISGAAPRRRQL